MEIPKDDPAAALPHVDATDPISSNDDQLFKSATMTSPDQNRDVTADFSSIIKQLSAERKNLLTVEGQRNPQTVESILRYFDLSRKKRL
jgi:hypothetical protein